MISSLARFRIVAQRVLTVLVGIAAFCVGTWAFPRSSHPPLVASHVVIGLIVVPVLLLLTVLLAFTIPDSQKVRRDIQLPAPRKPPSQVVSLTHRQRRGMKR